MVEQYYGGKVTQNLLCVVCFGLFVLFLKYHWNRRKLYLFSMKSHGPFAWPILGSVFTLIGSRDSVANEMKKLYDMEKSPTILWLGTKPHFIAKTPDEFSIILNSSKTLQKSSSYKIFENFVGNGIFNTLDVNQWRIHRRALSPTFNQAVLNAYSLVFQDHAIKLIKKFETFSGKGEIDVLDEMIKYTLGILNETAMGFEDNQLEDQDEYLHCFDRIREYGEESFMLCHVEIFQKIYDKITNVHEIIKQLRNYCLKVMALKRNENNNNNENYVKLEFDDRIKRKSFLELVLELTDKGVKFTEKDCIDEVLTFTVAGSDTCSFVSSAAILMLAMHPELQEQIYEEVTSISADKSQPITREDVPHFKLLDRFIKETMRLFPVGIMLGRHCTDDLDIGSTILPKGIDVLICIYGHHRNPKIWPDPLKFDPDRFLPEEVEKRHPYAYIPFSAGPRNCIGYRYAMMLLLMTLAPLVREFEFKTHLKHVSDIKLGFQVLTKSEQGFPVEITRRTK